jgi:hypothetical protein
MEEILEIVSIFAPEARGGRSESRGRKVGGRAEERADQVMDERDPLVPRMELDSTTTIVLQLPS